MWLAAADQPSEGGGWYSSGPFGRYPGELSVDSGVDLPTEKPAASPLAPVRWDDEGSDSPLPRNTGLASVGGFVAPSQGNDLTLTRASLMSLSPEEGIDSRTSNAHCFGPPAAPGTGATTKQLRDEVHDNGAEAEHHKYDPLNLFWFRDKVHNKGLWDYKQVNRGYENFGNYNYGFTGAAAGIAEDFLLKQAGSAQIAAHPSQPRAGDPGFLGWLGGSAPYGDDPHDQEMIRRGFWDRVHGC